MFEIFGIPSQALFGQLLLGLINGSFYALLSLGLAVIFGMLNIINFHPRRAVHDGRVRRLFSAAEFRHQLLGSLGDRADPGRRHRRRYRATFSPASAQARSALRAASHLRPRVGHRGAVPQSLGLVRIALSGARCAQGRAQSRLHVPAELPRLGHPALVGGMPRHLVCHRAHAARLLPSRGNRKSGSGARLRHQCAAHGDADLWLSASGSRRSPA